MATVFLVRDLKHDRPVALKVLDAELAQALGTERFQREIRLAARLQHPHILTVHDSGEAAGLFWFTMPYVEGETLRARLDRERQLPIADAMRIAVEAARALDHAHREGVVHRDIKPENILLTRDGDTLVADFGIARALTGSDDRVTGTGLAIGTPAYMSPEQASGEAALDPRTDIYSLSAVLYELLAGEAPFTGPTAQAVMAKRFQGEVPRVRDVRPSVPEALAAVVARGLAPVPADRFATSGEFATALAASLQADGTGLRTSTSPQRRPMWIAVTLGLLAVLIVGATMMRRAVGGGSTGTGTVVERPIRVAVLPFENHGDSSDAYFADGVTDAIRGKLSSLRGLEVIARPSSQQYAGSVLSPRQIAEELGVDFLLTGTVRWARQGDGSSRVQVSPELVEVADGRDRIRWQAPFDAPLTDVFQVQGEIAGRVAGALHLALSAAEQQELVVVPTPDLEAYDLFLKGEALTGYDRASIERAIEYYRQAVARDSTFGEAWGRLASRILSLRPTYLTMIVDTVETGPALARAIRYAPTSVSTYRARIADAMLRDQAPQADRLMREALTRHPSSSDLIRQASNIAFLLERPDEGVAYAERAHLLDPRSIRSASSLGSVYRALRRPGDAERVYRRALMLAPDDLGIYQSLILTYLDRADTSQVRRLLTEVPAGMDRAQLWAIMSLYGDFYWILDRAQQDSVLRMPVARFDGDSAGRALVLAQIYHQRRDTVQAVRWGAEAARLMEGVLRREAPDPQYHALQGVALAIQGKRGEATRAGERSVEGLTPSVVSAIGDYLDFQRARIAMLNGDRDRAITLLVRAYQVKFIWTVGPAALPLDPVFAPLRGQRVFDSLTATP